MKRSGLSLGSVVFLLLALGGALALAFVGLNAGRLLTSPARIGLFAGLPALAVLACLLALKLPRSARDSMAATAVAVFVGLYGGEAYLARPRTELSPAPGFDTRTKYEVVRDLRAEGKIAYPSVFPNYLLQTGLDGRTHAPFHRPDGTELLPLGGIAGVTTALCSEPGHWVLYDADEMGFNNPSGLWSAAPVDAIALGDSFTHGYCVQRDDSFVGRIRRAIPSLVNLGMSGSGPLLELATLSEFGPVLKPKRVFWFVFEGNDIGDLAVEKRSPLLMSAVDGWRTEDLVGQRQGVDGMLRRHVDTLLAADPSRRDTDAGTLQSVIGFVTLSHVRQILMPAASQPEMDFALLGRIFDRAQHLTASWDGELVIVYLPDLGSLAPAMTTAQTTVMLDATYAEVRQIAYRHGIKMVDVRARMAAHPDPLSFYPFRRPNHFNEIGHAAVAAAVVEALAEGTR